MIGHLSCRYILPLLVATAVCLACRPRGQTYYISSYGDDNNPGTQAKPYRTFSAINVLALRAGDSVLIRSGDTLTGPLILRMSGTRESPVFVGSDGKGMAVINGGRGEAVVASGSGFHLSNIHAVGLGRKSGNTTSGVVLYMSDGAFVEGITSEGFQKSGIELSDCHSVIVANALAFNNGFCGIYVHGASKESSGNITLFRCKAENNPGDPTILDNHSGNGILVGFSDSVTIQRCVATNNGWDMPRLGNGPVGIWAYESQAVLIDHCISYRNRTPSGAKDGGGFDLDGGVTHSVVQYCLSYENDGAGYGLFQYAGASPWANNVIRYCVSLDDALHTEGAGGFFVWNGANDSTQLANVLVHNNLVYAPRAAAVQFESSSLNTNFVFCNNIFIGDVVLIDGPGSGDRFTGNVWWSCNKRDGLFRGYPTFEAWGNATGREAHSGKLIGRMVDPDLRGPLRTKITDPDSLEFLTGVMLKPTSSIIDGGVPLPREGVRLKDFFGVAVPQGAAIDPGVSEYHTTQGE